MKRTLAVCLSLALLLSLIGGSAMAADAIAPPTVAKTASPTEINVAGSGHDEVTTITLSVTGAGGTATTSIPMDVVFAMDSSGSMGWNDPSGLRKTAAKSFVDKMNAGRDTAGVVSWDSVIDFTYGLSSDFATVKSRIDAVNASGGTNLNLGLNAAITMLDNNPRSGSSVEVIIFLTDGVGTYTGGPAAEATSKGYVIYAIGLGPEVAMGPLYDMASTTGGKAYTSPTAANLDAIFNEVFTSVVESTVPYNVDVIEVTQSYIIDEGAFSPPPSSVSTVGGITTIIWNNIGAITDGDPDFSADETVVLSFTARCDQVGTGLGVDVMGQAKVEYTDKEGNPAGSVDIPQAYVNVLMKDTTPPVISGQCVESVNPHGNTVPGEERDKNDKNKPNQNPDGFYLLDFTVEDNCDENPQLWVGVEGNEKMFQIEPGMTVKFTESVDAEPEMKKIGSPEQGGATAVTWHIILPGDPVLTAVDASGNEVSCTTCLVPPPPM